MTTLSYMIWNASPEIFTLPIPFIDRELTLRWYGLFFALGFLISQQILYYIFKKEGKPEKDVDTLTIYMVIATIIGARLGHVLFYSPEDYFSDPISILKIWEGGLASHGGAAGILIALWLYSRKKKPGQNYLQTLDRIVILVALTGALIRFGNLMNSEILGKETESSYGVVFARSTTETIQRYNSNVESISFVKNDSLPADGFNQPMKMLVEYKRNEFSTYEEHSNDLGNIVNEIRSNPNISEHIQYNTSAGSRLIQDESGTYYGVVNVMGIPRHPAQLYESISCLLLFVFLFWMWSKYKQNLPEGRLFAIFLIVCFGLRFVYEFLKINQVSFEDNLPLNMGQILSIPLVLAGVFMLIRSYRKAQ